MLQNRIALVTGAARGMGRATCLKMAGYGADIIAADIELAAAEKTAAAVRALGRRAIAVRMDVSDKAEVDAGFKRAVEEFGRLDILCNYAGIVIAQVLTEITEEQWYKSMDVNAKGALLVSQAAARIMIPQKYGRIINTASQSGTQGEYANGPYCISKATIPMLTQILAIELSKYNIICNSMSPGYTNSELFQNGMADRAKQEGTSAKALINDLMKNVPIGRAAEPEEIAELACFLASEKNTYLTGTDLLIAGGNVMH